MTCSTPRLKPKPKDVADLQGLQRKLLSLRLSSNNFTQLFFIDDEGALCPFVVLILLTMNNTILTRDEVSLLIHSVQRTLIKLEQYDPNSEIVRKHRVLLETMLDIEQALHTQKEKEPINVYK